MKALRILTGYFAVLVLSTALGLAQGENPSNREYQIKAAFIYNLIKFVEWPQEQNSDPNEPITIGILGKNPFGNAFDPIKNKPVEGKRIVIQRLKGMTEFKQGPNAEHADKELEKEIQAWRRCQILFICSSEQKYFKEILDCVKQRPILTVGDTKGFLEAGGIINFFIGQQKVCFEVNVVAAKQANLKIRSQFLRLAKRIIQPADAGGSEKKEN